MAARRARWVASRVRSGLVDASRGGSDQRALGRLRRGWHSHQRGPVARSGSLARRGLRRERGHSSGSGAPPAFPPRHASRATRRRRRPSRAAGYRPGRAGAPRRESRAPAALRRGAADGDVFHPLRKCPATPSKSLPSARAPSATRATCSTWSTRRESGFRATPSNRTVSRGGARSRSIAAARKAGSRKRE